MWGFCCCCGGGNVCGGGGGGGCCGICDRACGSGSVVVVAMVVTAFLRVAVVKAVGAL